MLFVLKYLVVITHSENSALMWEDEHRVLKEEVKKKKKI